MGYFLLNEINAIRIDSTSTRPIVMAAIISHLYPMGIATVVAPIEIPFVVSAEPTSKMASVKDTPIVVKITAKTTSTTIKRRIESEAERFSRLPFASVFFFDFARACSLTSTIVTFSHVDLAKAIILETRIPPAMEKAQPPMSISTIKMDRPVSPKEDSGR